MGHSTSHASEASRETAVERIRSLRRMFVLALVVVMYLLAAELGNSMARTVGGATVIPLVPAWLLPFCPVWALMLPGPRLGPLWALAGGLVFWLAELVAASLSGGSPLWPTGLTAVGWAAGAMAAVLVLNYALAAWRPGARADTPPRRQGGFTDRARAWRAWAVGTLMILFVAAWTLLVAGVYRVSGSAVIVCAWYWLLPFCPGWALALPTRRLRIFWSISGGVVFWLAELLRQKIGGGAYPWPIGLLDEAWALIAALLVWVLSFVFGAWSPDSSRAHSQPDRGQGMNGGEGESEST